LTRGHTGKMILTELGRSRVLILMSCIWTGTKISSKNKEVIMGMLIVRHKVKDFASWRKAFDSYAGAQRAAGLTNPHVY
jgi:hypothetical protein